MKIMLFDAVESAFTCVVPVTGVWLGVGSLHA